jgi:hypothetical protein
MVIGSNPTSYAEWNLSKASYYLQTILEDKGCTDYLIKFKK